VFVIKERTVVFVVFTFPTRNELNKNKSHKISGAAKEEVYKLLSCGGA
jgi:hypothetical protein